MPRVFRPIALRLSAALVLTSCSTEPAPRPVSSVEPASTSPTGLATRTQADTLGTVEQTAPESGPAATAAKRPKNVLLITVDSLRADMPWTGYSRPIAPNLTELARTSVVYTHAYAASSYTAKSVGAMLASRYPSSLYRSGWFFTAYSKDNRFFTEVLSEAGVQTLGWHGHMYFGRDKGLEQGFSEWKLVPGIDFDAETDRHVTSEKMTTLGIELLGKAGPAGPFFAWAHYMDPHDVYEKHAISPDFGKKNRDRYDSEVFFADHWIGKLFAWGKTQPWWNATAILVSSDHGEAFGEHGMYKHAFELWEVLCRVPLLVHIPGLKPKTIDLRRSQIDLGPTVLDLLGKAADPAFMGKSLVPELYGNSEPDVREPIVLELPEDSHNPPRRAIISGDFKLIVHGDSGKKLLFNLKQDPDETKDLAKEDPKALEAMLALFNETFAKIPSVKPYGGMKLKSGALANGPLGPKTEAQ